VGIQPDGGFEKDRNTTKGSAYFGQRWGGGWKDERLPWTYCMDRRLIYPSDLAGDYPPGRPARFYPVKAS
jgi:hypothetical protein